ncbi:MAG: hypothetical protein OHK0045_09210 [Raineya sp.]
MKELMKHLPAIKKFIEERTQTLQEISDNTIKKFLSEAYKLPFLFPLRIIVSEEKFVNFLFDMRRELFEGKKIEIATKIQESEENKTKEAELKNLKSEEVKKEKIASPQAEETKNISKAIAKPTKKTSVKKTTTSSEKTKKPRNKKEEILT